LLYEFENDYSINLLCLKGCHTGPVVTGVVGLKM
jgi:hypothetical protein